MEIIIGISSAISTTILLGIVVFLFKNWILERLKLSLQKEHSIFTEKLQWERKTREQAEKVAKYMSLARSLKEGSTDVDYREANTLSWELAMWLPYDVYKSLQKAMTQPNEDINPLSVVIDVRKVLLGNQSDNLTSDDVIHHAPGIGKELANKTE